MSFGKLPLGWWSQDMSLVQSMQVSMATLRAATTRHHHTDRVSRDTYHLKYLSSPAKGREMRELQAQMALKANCMFSHSWEAKHVSPTKPRIRPLRAWLPWKLAQVKLCLKHQATFKTWTTRFHMVEREAYRTYLSTRWHYILADMILLLIIL